MSHDIPPIEYHLNDESRERHRDFLEKYRALRRQEGRGSNNPEFYLRLPNGEFAEGRGREWKMRKESLMWLREFLSEVSFGTSLSILDAGAGNCWMTRYLAEWGHNPVALDLNDDDDDGLGAGRHYLERLPITFRRFVADFTHLPFPDGTFDLVIYNGALHYAQDVKSVIAEGSRTLKRGGRIVLIDTPFYRDRKSGEKMLAERDDPGRAGYLTYAGLKLIADELNLTIQFCARPTSFLHRLKRKLTELRLGREIASMPWTIIGKKMNSGIEASGNVEREVSNAE